MEHMDIGSLALLRNGILLAGELHACMLAVTYMLTCLLHAAACMFSAACLLPSPSAPLLPAPHDVPDDVCLYIAQCMVAGLTYLHRTLRIVHRDIKPSNVLLNSQGHVKLCDFSLSKTWTETMASAATTYVGTFLYMSPERIDPASQPDHQPFPGDVWALGLTLAELALKRYPLAESDAEVAQLAAFPIIHMILTSPLPRLRGRDDKLQAVVDGCLQRRVTERSSLEELQPMMRDASKDGLLNLLALLDLS